MTAEDNDVFLARERLNDLLGQERPLRRGIHHTGLTLAAGRIQRVLQLRRREDHAPRAKGVIVDLTIPAPTELAKVHQIHPQQVPFDGAADDARREKIAKELRKRRDDRYVHQSQSPSIKAILRRPPSRSMSRTNSRTAGM